MHEHRSSTPPHHIEIIEPEPEHCEPTSLPEGNVKLRNYRLVADNLRAYTPTGDVHRSPSKNKLVPRFDPITNISPPRERILELLRPEDPGREALEAIVKPAPRRGLVRPLDDDTRRFLERALLSPTPQGLSMANTPEPTTPEPSTPEHINHNDLPRTTAKLNNNNKGRSLADELEQAEAEARSGVVKRNSFKDLYKLSGKDAAERERLGRLALSVEEDESEQVSPDAALEAAARKLDSLLAESRSLHDELQGIHRDMQMEHQRANRCSLAARALGADAAALTYLDDVVALLKGDLARAKRARDWPFAMGQRRPGRNYII